MKKHSAKAARATSAPLRPDCDNSPPYPPKPPPPGNIPGKGVLDFVYYGAKDTALGYNDGQLTLHVMKLENEEKAYVFSLRGGPHKNRTLSKIALEALLGPCTVVIQNVSTTVLQTGDKLDLPAGSTFSFAAAAKAVLLGRSLSGPGLGEENEEEEEE